MALINHSCSPNVIVTYKGTTAEIRAVQDMSTGDEVRNLCPAVQTEVTSPSCVCACVCVGVCVGGGGGGGPDRGVFKNPTYL